MSFKEEKSSGVLGLVGNINRKSNPDIPNIGMYRMTGFLLDEMQSISKWNGMQKLNTVKLGHDSHTATFTGIFEYDKSDGTRYNIISTLEGIFKRNINQFDSLEYKMTGSWAASTAEDYRDAITYNDLFISGNGVNDNFETNGITMWNLGITAPTIAPTGDTSVAGILNGIYKYKYTYGNSSLGHESNPSPEYVTDDMALKKVTLSIPVSSDPQVNTINIYRTTENGGVFLYLDSIASVVGGGIRTYTDNNGDISLDVALDEFGNGVPPKFSIIELWNASSFMVPKNSSQINFSKSGYPNAWDSNDFRTLDLNDGEVITGVKRFQSLLVAFKGGSIWNISGYDRNTYGFTKQVANVGSVNNACIVDVPLKNKLCFLDKNGKFYFYDGISATPTAIGLEPLLKDLNQTLLHKCIGITVKSKNQCRWIVPNGSSASCDLLIWYDYIQDKWGTRDLTNTPSNYVAIMRDDNNTNQCYLGGYYNPITTLGGGYVWSMDMGGSDDGNAISCEVIDRGHPDYGGSNPPNIEEQKCFYHFFAWFKPVSNIILSISYAIDDPEGTYISIGTIDCSKESGQDHIHFRAIGRRIYFKIQESSIYSGLIIRGWKCYYKDLGRHNAP